MLHFGKNYKAEYDALGVIYTDLQREHAALEKEHVALIRAHHELEKERDRLTAQLETAQSTLEVFAYRIAEIGKDRDAFKAELDTLKQPALATDIKQSRTRKKPLAKVESNNG